MSWDGFGVLWGLVSASRLYVNVRTDITLGIYSALVKDILIVTNLHLIGRGETAFNRFRSVSLVVENALNMARADGLPRFFIYAE